MAASAALQIETEPQIRLQEYAHSNRAFIRWGSALALQETVDVELVAVRAEATYHDYTSYLREMINTDPDFGNDLDIDDVREHQIVAGKAVNVDGETLAEIFARGRDYSAELASQYEEFGPQATRDQSDVLLLEAAEELQDGEAVLAVHTAPEEALKQYPAMYKKLGYGKLSYIQYYAKKDGVLHAGSFSADMGDIQTWRDIFADRGIEYDPETDTDTFIRNHVKLVASPADAEQYARSLRAEVYGRKGITGQRRSVTEYLARNEHIVKGFFNNYYPALAEASNSGHNNQTMKDFARTILDANIRRLDSAVRAELVRVANSDKFDDSSINTMNSIICYAVVEQLRKGLKDYVNESKPNGSWNVAPTAVQSATVDFASIQFTNQLLARNLSNGVNAGRSYGGCPGNIKLDAESSDTTTLTTLNSDNNSWNSSFRGGSGREKWKLGKGKCTVTSCPTRPGEVTIGPCGVCMDRCQKLFDAGKDPTKMGSVTRKAGRIIMSANKPKPKPNKITTSPTKEKGAVRYT